MGGGRATVWFGLLVWPFIACLAGAPPGHHLVPPVAPAGEQVLYPAAMQGHWQGTLEVGSQKQGQPGRRFKVQLVYVFGRRLAPPDTTLAPDHRHAVVWETVSADTSSPGAGHFCEVLSFNSRAKVEMYDVAGETDSATGEATRAQVVHTSGRVCGLYNRTAEGELRLAWSTLGDGGYPGSFEPTASTQVATLSLLSEDIYPPELEGKWSGAHLLPKDNGIIQGKDRVELICSAGRCVYSGPAVPHANHPEPSVMVTDLIFFQKISKHQGKFCEFVSFSNTSAITVQPDQTHGQVQHGVDVHCNIYKRVGDTIVIAWGSDPTGAAPSNFQPSATSLVATLDLQPSSTIIAEMQGRWTGHVRERVQVPGTNTTQVRTQSVTMTCRFAHCVSVTQQLGDSHAANSVKVLTAIAAESTGLWSGQFCEMLTGATAEEKSGLSLSDDREWERLRAPTSTRTLSSVDKRMLRPTWDHLGQVRCSIFRRQGGTLKIASYIGEDSTDTLPDDYVLVFGKVASATFILDQGRTTAPSRLLEPQAYDATGVEVDAASPLSVFLTVDAPSQDALPPVDVASGYGLTATRGTRTPQDRSMKTDTRQRTVETLGSLLISATRAKSAAQERTAHAGSVLASMHQQLGLVTKAAPVPTPAPPTQGQGQRETSSTGDSRETASGIVVIVVAVMAMATLL